MRPIKYRVFNSEIKEMLFFQELFGKNIGSIHWDNSKGNLHPMQFTGLIDKNGNEIWEGDIYHQGDCKILYVVEWHDTGFMGRQIGTRGSRVGLEYWKENIEIIGNIYENIELIK